MVEPQRSQKTIRRMRFACWITKATDAHSEYELLIAFPQQQWLRERVLCYVIRILPVSLKYLKLFAAHDQGYTTRNTADPVPHT